MAKKLVNVSFVMPVLNEEHYLAQAVDSVFTQKLKGEMELVVALGPSKDLTNEVAKKLKRKYGAKLQLVHSTGLTSRSLNLAIEKSKYEVVLRVDAHSALPEGYAQLAVEILNQTGAANVGGMMVAKGKTDFQSAVAYGYNNRIGLGGGSFHIGGEAGPAETVYLGVFRKSALQEVGGFSESWVRGQDWELNQRLRAKGLVVWFDPRLQVDYFPRSNWESLAKQFFKTGMWRGALTRENPAGSSIRYWIPPILVMVTVFWFPIWIYLLAIGFVALRAMAITINQKLWLMVVLPTMHYGWGAGFWWGLFRGIKRP
ncbi:glycosyltransferase family 2 protein [Aquiluna borgnonia]|uniref:4,4'-diaponeurosporenoate glycosyltransferase n=1 Tax=Aquiluna borgnonia TaxID=2499157 RepID=A0A7D4QAT6_9MICO|nr:glycosyltransferase family 2 protein [Aquiluna borgnonia]QKJ24750.1 glycosyltransferase family 2 protein [Aquiluna borgnonia]